MATLLKHYYSDIFYGDVAACFKEIIPGFDKDSFFELIYTDAFEQMELKQRMRHTVKVMHWFMPADFKEGIATLKKIITTLRKNHIGEDQLAYMFLPDYIEVYGLDDYDAAVDALEFTTQFVSCEFAVRPFLSRYGDKMLAQMLAWASHPSYKVRRFASEGSRPRLPWGLAVPALKKNPALVMPILEKLMTDLHPWVRLSVANNLNDIAKTHPEIVLDVAKRWSGMSKETDAIIKHGSRTLLKQGHKEILAHYGLTNEGIILSDFKLLTPKVSIGQSIEFTFAIDNNNPLPQTIRLEYAIYFRIKSGQLSKKVFKISERIFQPGERSVINRKQKFMPITTRRYYLGGHQMAIIVNGAEQEAVAFELTD